MEIRKVLDNVYMVNLEPPIQGFEKFIASYIVMGEKTAVIDTGPTCSIQNLLNALDRLKIPRENVSYVMLTHIHIDHAGGAGSLLKKLPNAKLVVHSKGAFHMSNPKKLWESTKLVLGRLAEEYGEVEPTQPEKILVGTDELNLYLGGGIKIKVFDTPGHAPHHLSFYEEKNGILFVGEVGGVYLEELDLLRPSTPPPGFNLNENLRSIDRLVALNPKILCYSHFGFTKKIQNLLLYKEKLNLWLRIVKKHKQKTEEEIFKKILEEDKDLNLLKKLETSSFERERFFIINNVKGLIQYIEKFEKQT